MDHGAVGSARLDACERDEDLLRRLEPLVRSVVARFARDRTTADELAQACRIRIYKKREQIREPDAVFGWARTVCRRVCIDATTHERRDRERLVDDDRSVAVAGSMAQDPLAAIECREMQERVRSSLGRLSPEQRQLLILRYWRGLSIVEIGSHLNVPEATVRSRLRRARRRLRCAPEIICYAPRRESLWSRQPQGDKMEAAANGSTSSKGKGAP
ncbi:MAG: sigma-70 family RNA polymerase sigma factor [Gemmatimonadetes bacterium]|nr:sigma-70 family RNA polymerase sigma factor [Gemmatimonadota bacterium]